jgi:hypothetical protein
MPKFQKKNSEVITPLDLRVSLKYRDTKRLRYFRPLNWSGRIVAGPRSEIEEILVLEEAKKPGVYFLIGENPETCNKKVYIGQSTTPKNRIRQHLRKKDFWTEVVLVVCMMGDYTEGHMKYLEGRLIEEAKKANRFEVENGPRSGSPLSSGDKRTMEEFFKTIKESLPLVSEDFLTPEDVGMMSDVFKLTIKGLTAQGRATSGGGFIVFKNSQAVADERPSVIPIKKKFILDRRDKLVNSGTLVRENGCFTFKEDTKFDSPTAAAEVIYAGTAQGPEVWKDKDKNSLKARGWIDTRKQRRCKP